MCCYSKLTLIRVIIWNNSKARFPNFQSVCYSSRSFLNNWELSATNVLFRIHLNVLDETKLISLDADVYLGRK